MANTSDRMPHSTPSKAELEARIADVNRNDPRNRLYQFNRDRTALEEAYQLTRRSSVTPSGKFNNAQYAGPQKNPDVVDESLAASLPIASGRGEFARTQAFGSTLRKYGLGSAVTAAYSVLTDQPQALDDLGFPATAGTYYNPTDYDNLANDPRDNAYGPAAITQRPTSTSNPRRPRTVAAGYDRRRSTLTIVFRDGTFYNYYEVSAAEWGMFKSLASKGRYIRDVLDRKPRGSANVSYLSEKAQELLYRVSRTTQILYEGAENIRPRRQPRVQANLYKANPGKNPSRGGINPANKSS